MQLGLFAQFRSANYAHKPLKTRPQAQIFDLYLCLDIYGDPSCDFTVSSDLLRSFSTSQLSAHLKFNLHKCPERLNRDNTVFHFAKVVRTVNSRN